jgi:hypothetical protein
VNRAACGIRNILQAVVSDKQNNTLCGENITWYANTMKDREVPCMSYKVYEGNPAYPYHIRDVHISDPFIYADPVTK